MINVVKMDKFVSALGWRYNEYDDTLNYKTNGEVSVKGIVDLDEVPHLLWQPEGCYLYIRVIGDTIEGTLEDFNEKVTDVVKFLRENEKITNKLQKEAEERLKTLKGE